MRTFLYLIQKLGFLTTFATSYKPQASSNQPPGVTLKLFFLSWLKNVTSHHTSHQNFLGRGGFGNPGFVANVQLLLFCFRKVKRNVVFLNNFTYVLFSHSKKKCGVFKQIDNFTYVLFSQSKKKCGALVSV